MIISNLKGEELIIDKLIYIKVDGIEIMFTADFIESLLFDKSEETWNKLNPTER